MAATSSAAVLRRRPFPSAISTPCRPTHSPSLSWKTLKSPFPSKTRLRTWLSSRPSSTPQDRSMGVSSAMKILRALVSTLPLLPPGVSWVELVLFQSIGGDMCRQRRHSNELAAKVVNTYWLRVKMAAGSRCIHCKAVTAKDVIRNDLRRETTCGARRALADFALCDRFPPTLSIATLGNWNAKSISFRFMEMSRFGA